MTTVTDFTERDRDHALQYHRRTGCSWDAAVSQTVATRVERDVNAALRYMRSHRCGYFTALAAVQAGQVEDVPAAAPEITQQRLGQCLTYMRTRGLSGEAGWKQAVEATR